ncbi:MAG: HAMP domain-containing sensor histidine kinase [Burkholderiaceae bacterium]
MSPPSIRGRLSRRVLQLSLVWALLASLAVWLVVQQEVDELLDEALQDSADVMAELLDASAQATAGLPRVIAASKGGAHFAWQVVDDQGRVLLRSELAPASAWHARPRLGLAEVPGEWRSYGRNLAPGQYLYAAQTRRERHETLAFVGLATAGTAVLIGGICMLWLSAQVRRELQPLTEFSRLVHEHDPLARDAPLPPAAREELQPMRDAIEGLGQRLARRIANERAFTAHAAHALRTPLAGMDAQLAVALREAGPDAQPRLLRTREAAARLRRVVTALLTLFRSGVDLQWQAVDIAALVGRLPVDGLTLALPADATVMADPDLLAAALINLLDNALRHGAQQLRIETQGQCIRLHDDGRGVAPARLAELQQALAQERYEGSMGLGLMLADIVARAHGGSLRLLGEARGFGVEMALGEPPPDGPAAPPP